jgi:hypothetical protein
MKGNFRFPFATIVDPLGPAYVKRNNIPPEQYSGGKNVVVLSLSLSILFRSLISFVAAASHLCEKILTFFYNEIGFKKPAIDSFGCKKHFVANFVPSDPSLLFF